jgi:protein Tex
VVTNVAAFGAFVDVGVHQDGLVHVSAMSRSFVSDPRSVVKPGDVVRVKVLSVDGPRRRIALTLRLDDDGPRPAGGRARGEDRSARTSAARTSAAGNSPAKKSPAQNKGRTDRDSSGALADALRRAGLAPRGRPGGR